MPQADGVKFQYTVKQSATNEAILNKQKTLAQEKMIGTPSMNFIRKIYNLITHKQEQLEEINHAEKMVEELYNGDLNLAREQVENGNYSEMTRVQLDSIAKKEQIQESLDEYLTIFNIYKQFHKKSEEKKPDVA